MLANLQNPFALAARFLMAMLFLPSGIGKIAGFAGTAGYIGATGLPFPELGAALAIAVEAGGALALIMGFQTRWVALIMAVFTVAAGLFFHQYWAAAPGQAMMQQIMFFKNIAIAGGLLMMTAFGAGAWSLDARRAA
jgi:putative oxidoreductase